MRFKLRAKTRSLSGSVNLPASKSISNRLLIIQALSEKSFQIDNLSKADDTVSLQLALERNDIITDVGPAGTAMRFLTAFYASRPGEKVLTGSDRMKQRPISILVDALRELGANINYLEKEGFPPLHIEGRRLSGGTISVSGSVSSQFITSLMLIGPTLPQPLVIHIDGDPLSRPYIIMTQKLMQSCGAQVEVDQNAITIKPGRYRSANISVEYDWSSAAFWMAFAVAANRVNLRLNGLRSESIQGDSDAIKLFEGFGIEFEFTEAGLLLKKPKDAVAKLQQWNFRNHPDLVQPAVIAAASIGQAFLFEGLDNLRLKETDRIAALQNEIEKIGLRTSFDRHSLKLESGASTAPSEAFEVYADHRMAMSLAALSMIFPEFTILDPMVVSKSYPGFWKEVEKFVDVRAGK